jgi:hypothetical protein
MLKSVDDLDEEIMKRSQATRAILKVQDPATILNLEKIGRDPWPPLSPALRIESRKLIKTNVCIFYST